jgi:DNA polymerase III subunit gamma/tau
MAHIPLHHKYRPQTFADLVGQEAIATTLSNALRLHKIAPAYLFTGPRGTGKTSSARILAKSLNCMASQVPTSHPCGDCHACNSIALGSALDIIEIDAASNTGVDNIRELIERAQYAPVQCRYKVYIIDECHMLTTAAFNSLLKTLEEPPPHVVFILATTDPQRVLPTIISRCQRFDYRRIPVAAMVEHLTYIATTEQIEIPAASILLIAQLAQGGLRDAESLLDQLSLLNGDITPDRVWDLVGSVPEQELLCILQSIVSNDPEVLIDRTRNLLERGKEPLTVLQNLAGCYRDLLIAKTAPKRPDLVALTSETWTELIEIAQTWKIDRILAGQKYLKDSELQVKHTTQPGLWLEIILLGLLAVETQQTTVGNVASPISIPATPQLSPPQSTSPPPDRDSTSNSKLSIPEKVIPISMPSAAPQAEIGMIDIDLTWEQVLQQLLPASRDLFKPFGKLITVTEEQVVVAMKSATMQTIASGKVPELAKVFSQLFGRSIGVKLEVMGKISTQPNISPPTKLPEPAAIATPPVPVTPPPISAPSEYLADDEPDTDDNEEIDPAALSINSEPLSIDIPRSPELVRSLHLVEPTPPQPAMRQLDELDPPSDFAEPPDSLDLDRATRTIIEPDEHEVEIDPSLKMATDNIVTVFNGNIIDRTHDLFQQIANNK